MTAARSRRWLAGAAVLAGALAPLAGSPLRRPTPRRAPSDPALAALPAATSERAATAPVSTTGVPSASVDVTELLRAISAEEDHVSAVELAGWIRDGRPGLRVLDVRSADEFAAYHVPGAEHVPIDLLASVQIGRDETIVLYSDRGAHGGQAWVLLRSLGHRRVYFLRDGIHEWLDDVLHPAIAADAAADPRAAVAAELSRYFGGSPRNTPGDGATAAAASAVPRWRGC